MASAAGEESEILARAVTWRVPLRLAPVALWFPLVHWLVALAALALPFWLFRQPVPWALWIVVAASWTGIFRYLIRRQNKAAARLQRLHGTETIVAASRAGLYCRGISRISIAWSSFKDVRVAGGAIRADFDEGGQALHVIMPRAAIAAASAQAGGVKAPGGPESVAQRIRTWAGSSDAFAAEPGDAPAVASAPLAQEPQSWRHLGVAILKDKWRWWLLWFMVFVPFWGIAAGVFLLAFFVIMQWDGMAVIGPSFATVAGGQYFLLAPLSGLLLPITHVALALVLERQASCQWVGQVDLLPGHLRIRTSTLFWEDFLLSAPEFKGRLFLLGLHAPAVVVSRDSFPDDAAWQHFVGLAKQMVDQSPLVPSRKGSRVPAPGPLQAHDENASNNDSSTRRLK